MEPKFCWYCDIGFKRVKGGCQNATIDCKNATPNFDGEKCVSAENFTCLRNNDKGYHANEKSANCIFCDIGFKKFSGSCVNATK